MKFPNIEENAPAEFTVVPGDTIVPDGIFGIPLGHNKLILVNEAKLREQIANPMAFMEEVNPTGNINDIPFSE